MVMAERLTVGPQGPASDAPAQDGEPVAAFMPPAGVHDEQPLHPDVQRLVSMVENNEELALPVTVEMALSHIEDGNPKAALELLDGVVGEMTTADRLPAIRRETGHALFAFKNRFEAALHFHLTGRDYISVAFPEALFGAFCVYGWLLVEAGRHDDAARSLETAIMLNPCSCEPVFERAEIHKARGDLDGFLSLTMKAFEVAYSAVDLGRCLRNHGYYEIECGNYDLAAASLWRSLAFDPASGLAWNELAYIRERTGQPLVEPSPDAIKTTLTTNNIPIGASAAVIAVASTLARDSMANGKYEDALLATSILSDLSRG